MFYSILNQILRLFHTKFLLWLLIVQIMPKVFILGCIYGIPANRDNMKGEGLKHIPIL